MDFNSTRVKYTIIFSTIMISLVASILINVLLINKHKNGINIFAKGFNPAVSSVLNADRDLHQARMAELQILMKNATPAQIKMNRSNFESNAQQAYDRMIAFEQYMSNYPRVIQELNKFDIAFNDWKSEATKVFKLIEEGKLEEAERQSTGLSLYRFKHLRSFYDIAGEIARNKNFSLNRTVVANN